MSNEQVLRAYREPTIQRGVASTFGVARQRVLKWLEATGARWKSVSYPVAAWLTLDA
jgi:hypothetical protein